MSTVNQTIDRIQSLPEQVMNENLTDILQGLQQVKQTIHMGGIARIENEKQIDKAIAIAEAAAVAGPEWKKEVATL